MSKPKYFFETFRGSTGTVIYMLASKHKILSSSNSLKPVREFLFLTNHFLFSEFVTNLPNDMKLCQIPLRKVSTQQMIVITIHIFCCVVTLSSPIITSSISLQEPSLTRSGLSNVDTISEPNQDIETKEHYFI